MRELNECQAEVFRRSEKRIKERKQRRNHILMACIPLALCLTIFGVFLLPNLYHFKPAPGDAGDKYYSAMGEDGSTDVPLGTVTYAGTMTPQQENKEGFGMLENIPSIVIASLFLGAGALAMGGIIAREIKNRFAPTKTVEAVVIDKHKAETFSKYSGNGKRERYVVVFCVHGKKKSFYVSQFSYSGYRMNEKGMLTYKGSRLVDFR